MLILQSFLSIKNLHQMFTHSKCYYKILMKPQIFCILFLNVNAVLKVFFFFFFRLKEESLNFIHIKTNFINHNIEMSYFNSHNLIIFFINYCRNNRSLLNYSIQAAILVYHFFLPYHYKYYLIYLHYIIKLSFL